MASFSERWLLKRPEDMSVVDFVSKVLTATDELLAQEGHRDFAVARRRIHIAQLELNPTVVGVYNDPEYHEHGNAD